MSLFGAKEIIRIGNGMVYETQYDVSPTSKQIFYWKLDSEHSLIGPFATANEAIKSLEAYLEYTKTIPVAVPTNIVHVNFRTKKRIS